MTTPDSDLAALARLAACPPCVWCDGAGEYDTGSRERYGQPVLRTCTYCRGTGAQAPLELLDEVTG